MPTRDNRTPPDTPLRIGLITDNEQLPLIAEALRRPSLEIVAQGGMRQGEALPGVAWHDDMRVLIAQSDIQALVLAASTRVNREMTRHALARGLHVWRTAPLARSFALAAEEAKLAQSTNAVYRVQSSWRHMADNVRWALGLSPGFRPQYCEMCVAAPGPPVQSWRASETDAAGGVLAADAYPLLEAWIAIRKMPENLVARVGACRRRATETARETEDVAIVTVRDDDGGLGLIRAVWDIEPYEYEFALHGADVSILIGANAVRVRLANQTQLDERKIAAPDDRLRAEITLFESAIRRGAAGEARSVDPDLPLHLAATALLETIYLSSRTNQPETPKKLYEVQGWPYPE